jgi:hypothetical protein
MSTELGHPAVADGLFTANALVRDLFGLVTGKYLGAGIAREVYEYGPDPGVVIKFEVATQSFQNVGEWEVWDRVKDVPNLRRWFAPCIAISPCGCVMLQKRAYPAQPKDYPSRVPMFFTDIKRANWGRIDDKIVCVDYGRHRIMEQSFALRMRKADWY